MILFKKNYYDFICKISIKAWKEYILIFAQKEIFWYTLSFREDNLYIEKSAQLILYIFSNIKIDFLCRETIATSNYEVHQMTYMQFK